MDKRSFYKIQSEAFRDYATKFPNKSNLLSLFNEWAESKGIYGLDKQEIWRLARKLQPYSQHTINENSDDFVRIDSVLKIILDADMKRLATLIEKREGQSITSDIKLDKT
jgi:hypothetical protein